MNIYLDTIGCRLNQSEIETFARQFRLAGHTLVETPAKADLVVINTCTVTADAASDSRQKIRQSARAGASQVVVTGCWATREPATAAALPKVSQVVPNSKKDLLVANLLHIAPEIFDQEFINRLPIPGERSRTRAFIKVQDGCDNHCTFCITALARGPSCSRPIAEILADIRSALAGGVKEVVLTGVNLGSWGQEWQPAQHLKHLIEVIFIAEPELPRLRLSSLEPWNLDASFFALWHHSRLCRHLHLPLQSGSAATLRRMARKTTPKAFAELVRTARVAIPVMAITTDVIVGFPGEDDAEFDESLTFIQEQDFAGGHVFTYSARPGTAATLLPLQIPHTIARERSVKVRRLFAEAAHTFQTKFTDCQLPVLWESRTKAPDGSWKLSGLTDNYLRISASADADLWNQISLVRLTGQADAGMQGIICK